MVGQRAMTPLSLFNWLATYLGNLSCFILQRRLHPLDTSICNQAIHALVFICDVRNHLIQLLAMRDIDLTIIQRAPEMMRELIPRLPEVFLRLLGSIETVDVPAGFDKNLCECETEASSPTRHDKDPAIELYDREQFSDEHSGSMKFV